MLHILIKILFKLNVMALCKEEIRNLMKSNSERINLCQNSAFIKNHPELHQLVIDGIENSTYVYCKRCKSLIKKFKWSTSNLSRHCSSNYHIFQQRKYRILSEKLKREMIMDRYTYDKEMEKMRLLNKFY